MPSKTYLPSYLCEISDGSDSSDNCESSDSNDSSESRDSSDQKLVLQKKKNYQNYFFFTIFL